MDVRIKGIRKEQVEIEVTPEALIRGLQEHFGITELFTPRGDNYWSWSEDGNSMVERELISYHGSPQYMTTGRAISDEKQLTAFMLLTELQKLLEVKHEQVRN